MSLKIGGLARYIKDREAICLMNDQARHIYKAVESENIANVYTIKQDIKANGLDNNNREEEDKINVHASKLSRS